MIGLIVLIVGVPAIMALLFFGSKKTYPSVSLSIDQTATPAIAPRNLSAVAQQVYKEYMSLPAESRPFDNISEILKSLDAVTVTPDNKRRDHFDSNLRSRHRARDIYYGDVGTAYPFRFTWDTGDCSHNDCKYSAYYALHVEIGRVKKALDDKARALVESENAHNVSMAAELVNALREEAGIQEKVTAELRS